MAYPVDVFVERLAATSGQIDEFGLITQPVTISHSRARMFVERLDTETVELDAIPASEIRRLVRKASERHMDPRKLALLRMVEEEERTGLQALLEGAQIRDAFGRNKSSERIGRALELLEEHGKVSNEVGRTRGRPAERWFAL